MIQLQPTSNSTQIGWMLIRCKHLSTKSRSGYTSLLKETPEQKKLPETTIKEISAWRHRDPKCIYTTFSEVPQSCSTLCDPMDCSLLGSSIHGIFQATVQEWVTISFFRESTRPRDWTWVSHIVGRRFYYLSHQGSFKMYKAKTGRWELWGKSIVKEVAHFQKYLLKSTT